VCRPDEVSREHRGHRAEHKRTETGVTAELSLPRFRSGRGRGRSLREGVLGCTARPIGPLYSTLRACSRPPGMTCEGPLSGPLEREDRATWSGQILRRALSIPVRKRSLHHSPRVTNTMGSPFHTGRGKGANSSSSPSRNFLACGHRRDIQQQHNAWPMHHTPLVRSHDIDDRSRRHTSKEPPWMHREQDGVRKLGAAPMRQTHEQPSLVAQSLVRGRAVRRTLCLTSPAAKGGGTPSGCLPRPRTLAPSHAYTRTH